MQRRVLLQSSMGLLMLSPWGFVRSGETLPSDAEVPGPRFHVAGNHDFDKISLEDFLAHTENSDEMKGLTHYAFTKGGIKYIVLDACYNTMAGEHYSDGNLKWSVSMVPDFEVEWLRKVLAE